MNLKWQNETKHNLLVKAVLEPRVSPAFASTYLCNHCNIRFEKKNIQSMWIHWTFFPKTWTKGHWPLHDLWPHICWGHMCDSTQGSLCPSPMAIHQCMWIQWSILQITIYITYYIYTTYILRTYYVQNEWSHSLLLNSVQARQKSEFRQMCLSQKMVNSVLNVTALKDILTDPGLGFFLWQCITSI